MAAASAVPVETLAPEQLPELHTWLDRQPAVPEAMPQGDVKVLLLKFNDYQCPSCRQAYILCNSIIEKYVAAYPGVFRYESRDFPLESECGAGGVHAAACEAAVAVRLAKGKNLVARCLFSVSVTPHFLHDSHRRTGAEMASSETTPSDLQGLCARHGVHW